MARKPVTIPIASDTRQFARGIKDGVTDPLDDMVDALKDADRAADDTGDTLTDAMRDAQRATAELDDEQDKLRRTLEAGSSRSFKKFGDDADAGMNRAEEATKEFKDEAVSNVSEVASSFTGDMDSAIDLVQGTLGGLAGSIPGVGIALAGLGAAAGLFYNQWKEKTEATKQRVQDMYDDMAESGADFLSKEFITQRINDIVSGADGAVISFKNLRRAAKDTGTSQADLLLAFGGDLKKRRELIEKLKDDVVDLQGAQERAAEGTATAQDEQTIAAANLIRKLREQNGETAKATEAVQAQREAVSKLNATQGRTYDDMLRNQGAVYDSLGTIKDAVNGIPQSHPVTIPVTADTSKVKRQIKSALQGTTFEVPVTVRARAGTRVQ